MLRPIAHTSSADVAISPSERHRVSVVIPNYNYARFLPECIESVLSQEGVDVDVIVVDDASTDESAKVIGRLVAEHDRVQSVFNPENRGAVRTFNAGLALAEGEWIVRLDADDLLTPGSLARATALGERYHSVGLVYGRPLHFHGPPPERGPGRPSGWTVWSGDEWLELRCRLGVNCITSPEVVMRARDVAKIGGQREDLPHAHDMEMWLRLATVSDVAHVDGVVQALHREHPASLSAVQVDVVGDLYHRAAVYGKLFQGGDDRELRLLGLARRALADEALTRLVQAYAAGRDNTEETDAYLEFAGDQGVPWDELPTSRTVDRVRRLGMRRAHRSPSLLVRAAVVRLRSQFALSRTLRTGI